MKLGTHIFALMMLAAGLLTTVCMGCSATVSEKPTIPEKVTQTIADEPAFEVAGIHILPQATEERILPFVATTAGKPIETPCLERSNKKTKQWTTENAQVLEALRQNQVRVSSSIVHWLQSEAPEELPAAEMATWKALIFKETVMIRHFNTDDVGFVTEQSCISNTARMLPETSEVVTTLFGATRFSLLSQSPMTPQTVKALKKLAQKKRIRSKAVPTFSRAKDEKGNLMSQKGKPLYMAPDGTLVLKKDVPPPKKRPVFELQLTVPKGVYVAVGHMPKTRFVAHKAPPGCQTNLIFDDLTPRVPKCLGNSEMGFGVSMSKNPAEVLVKAATVDATGQSVIPFDSTAMVQVGGTGFAWITPRRLEEGAILQVDTLILHPRKTAAEELKKFSYGK